MKKISSLLEESVFNDETPIPANLIDEYFKKFGRRKEVSDEVEILTNLCMQNGIDNKSDFNDIVAASGSAVKAIGSRLNIGVDAIKDIKTLINKLIKKSELNYVPLTLGIEKICNLIDGKFDFDETTLDFETQRGQNEIVKKFKSVVAGAIKGYSGKSGLTDDDLWSVGLAVMGYCIKTYNKPEKVSLKWALGNEVAVRSDDANKALDAADDEMNKNKSASFRTYLTNAINNAIKIEMNQNSRNVRINQAEFQKGADEGTGVGRETSIDKAFGDEDSGSTDHYKFLGDDEKFSNMDKGQEDAFKKFLEILTKFYGARDVEWLKKSFGIGTPDDKKMSQAEIGKEAGVSQKAVSKALDKMLKDIMTNPKLKPYKELVRQAFFESLCYNTLGLTRQEIRENLLANDTFILFVEENNAAMERDMRIGTVLVNNFSPEDAKWLKEALDGSINLRSEFAFNRSRIRRFLNQYDIFENYNYVSDNELFNKFSSLCETEIQ